MLVTGQRLGPYEVTGPLGVGGMGEVYRARDTRLGRDVALKVLREDFAVDHDRMARFEREARVLASLNHPNIAATYGLEESSSTCALVLELVEGPTLADGIRHGPMRLDEALPIARQIAEGLEYAHEHGVIHRDLKPANVKVTPDGQVKVLDFGLAKALQPDTETDLNLSPTVSTSATRAGILLGTPAYMAPEQVRAKPGDRRLDIWAFGCVLFEMLTGRPAFSGETLSDVLSAVLQGEPDWSLLPETTPPPIRLLLRRCLRKELKRRLHHISDARIEIEEALLQTAETGPAQTRTLLPYRNLLWPLAAITLLAIGYAAWLLKPPEVLRPRSPTRLTIVLPRDQRLVGGFSSSIALSPDGSRLVYVGRSSEDHGRGPQLYVRALDEFTSRPLEDTGDANTPFFSPDGQWVGFFARGKLWKIPIVGGAPLAICDAARVATGATWEADDNIIFTVFGSGLMRVSANGGQPEALTTPDSKRGEVGHQWPQVLPDQKGVLFAIVTSGGGGRIVVLSPGTGDQHLLLEGTVAARYIPTGHLIYMERRRDLWAVPFNLANLKVSGSPARVIEDAGRQFAISDSGSLVYAVGQAEKTELVWVDRKGLITPITEGREWYSTPRLSPDGRRLAVTIGEEGASRDIWVFDWERNVWARLTQTGNNSSPVWSPDGSRIAFASAGSGSIDIYSKAADGSGEAEPLLERDLPQVPDSWSPDGRSLVFWQNDPNGRGDLWTLSMADGRRASPLIATSFNELGSDLSPSGNWLSYTSDESGRDEVYVAAFPSGKERLRISVNGGLYPVWSADGKELFYREPSGQTMVVAVRTEPKLAAGRPQVLFEGRFIGSFDVSPDNRRFVMTQRTEDPKASAFELRVVLNWFESLRHQVPAGSN